jgi:hypothetical protein
MDADIRERLREAGLTPGDFAWFESFGWDDAKVPSPKPEDISDFQRREAALNAAVAPLSFAERGASIEGRLAAAIGARCADARDRETGDED